jgi:transcriptional regulator GlxA family with amidase domain
MATCGWRRHPGGRDTAGMKQHRSSDREPEDAPTPGADVRHIVLLVCPNTSALEIAGPAEVFSRVAHKLREAGRTRTRAYQVHLVSATRETSLRTGSGIHLVAECSFGEFALPIDTLLVVGGLDVWSGEASPALLPWLRRAAAGARRYGSVCTGAFLLAEAGLLDGQRVTTHWFFCERLAREYPALIVDPNPVFIRNGRVFTSAGVTSGIDLALCMVEDDTGLDIAMRVARGLVLYVRRPGWQSQFSNALALQAPTRLTFRDLPFWMIENLHLPLTIDDLAARVAMSPRNFTRQFSAEFGLTPARLTNQLRAEAAVRLLHESAKSREEIASDCGFGSIDSMERAVARPRLAFGLDRPLVSPP